MVVGDLVGGAACQMTLKHTSTRGTRWYASQGPSVSARVCVHVSDTSGLSGETDVRIRVRPQFGQRSRFASAISGGVRGTETLNYEL